MSKKSRELELIRKIAAYLELPIDVDDDRREKYEETERHYIAYASRSFAFEDCSENKQNERLDELEEILSRFKDIYGN
jgi:hypothetical protein